ncbi:hypothetical protein Neosp_006738 [[Neocosmospora] mangrovei]
MAIVSSNSPLWELLPDINLFSSLLLFFSSNNNNSSSAMAPSKTAGAAKKTGGAAAKSTRSSARIRKQTAAKNRAARPAVPRYSATNPPPNWTPVPLDPPCENCIRGANAGKGTLERCLTVYGCSDRCQKCFETSHACHPCRKGIAPLARRLAAAEPFALEDDDPADSQAVIKKRKEETKLYGYLKKGLRVSLKVMDADAATKRFYSAEDYQPAQAAGSVSSTAQIGASLQAIVTQQVAQQLAALQPPAPPAGPNP